MGGGVMPEKFFFTGIIGVVIAFIISNVFSNPFPGTVTKAEVVTALLLIISLLDLIISSVFWIWS